MPESTPTSGQQSDRAADPLAAPRLPGTVSRFWRRHPWWVDALLAGLYLLISLFGIFSVFLATGVSDPVAVVVVLLIGAGVATAALLVRRRHPLITFAVIWGATIVAVVVDGSLDPFGIALALYAVAVYRSTVSAWIAFGASAIAGVALTAFSPLDGSAPAEFTLTVNPLFVLITLVATLIGINAGGRRRYVEALLDRSERLVRERDQEARLAAVAERTRIAREMHDVVAHGLSVMVSLSDGAAALADKDPARSRAAIEDIGDVGRRSLTEMRRVIGALGSEDIADADAGAPLHPQPALADLPDLVSTFRAAGLPVIVETDGEPPAADGVQTVIHRIVQESLTNALRYSDNPGLVLVRLVYRGGGAEITVTDDGRGQRMPPPSVGGGRGLVGIRERALLYGGTVDAGPLVSGGWRVRVTLPQAGEDG